MDPRAYCVVRSGVACLSDEGGKSRRGYRYRYSSEKRIDDDEVRGSKALRTRGLDCGLNWTGKRDAGAVLAGFRQGFCRSKSPNQQKSSKSQKPRPSTRHPCWDPQSNIMRVVSDVRPRTMSSKLKNLQLPGHHTQGLRVVVSLETLFGPMTGH